MSYTYCIIRFICKKYLNKYVSEIIYSNVKYVCLSHLLRIPADSHTLRFLPDKKALIHLSYTGDADISCYPSPVCVFDGKRGPPGAHYRSCQMIGTEWRSHGTLNTWSRLPQDVSGRWHGYPLLA